MTPEMIKKRNGDLEPFQRSRIEVAIQKATLAAGEFNTDFVSQIVDEILEEIEEYIKSQGAHVEMIQDAVEIALMRHEKYAIAKNYILYRERHSDKRKKKAARDQAKLQKNELKVTKHDGTFELFDWYKIEEVFSKALKWYEEDCSFWEFSEIFKKHIVDKISTKDIQKMMIKTCIDCIQVENIAWQEVAARLLLFSLYKESARNRGISYKRPYTPQNFVKHFYDYLDRGLYYQNFLDFYSEADLFQAGEHINNTRDLSYTYTTILSFSKNYLLNPNKIIRELPQEMYMAVALFLAIPETQETRLSFALRVYDVCSKQMLSLPTPTLVNARTNYNQLSSCFKITVDDDLRGIYHSLENMAQISKYGGGVGVYMGNVRSQGAFVRGNKGASGGVLPWIKLINNTAVAVNQLGVRLGAISTTLDVWHRDIYDFLDMQTETGDVRTKAFDVFPAVSVPDLFMKRVEKGKNWSLFDPYEIKEVTGRSLQDFFCEDFDKFYLECEKNTKLTLKKEVSAKDLFKKFLKTTVETGMPYVFFRDSVNRVNPNKHAGNIYSTQLCTEICQNMSRSKFLEETVDEKGNINIKYSPGDTVVCNLASINIAKVHTQDVIQETIPVAMRILDNVITLNFYPIKEAQETAKKYRSVGLGYMGLAEYLACNGYAYESKKAREHVHDLFHTYARVTYQSSVDLAKERWAYPLFQGSEYDKWKILWKTLQEMQASCRTTTEKQLWKKIYEGMKECGIRFAYHSAPAPNTGTSWVVGTTAGLLPIYKKYFVETNISSPTVRVAPYLSSKNFWLYKEYVHMDMHDVISMISVIYPWIDQSISFEWMIDPERVSPYDLYSYYFQAWKQGIKTVYYVRSLSASSEKADCVSCSG